MRKSLTNTSNHIAYKYIHVYMQVHINYQKFLNMLLENIYVAT